MIAQSLFKSKKSNHLGLKKIERIIYSNWLTLLLLLSEQKISYVNYHHIDKILKYYLFILSYLIITKHLHTTQLQEFFVERFSLFINFLRALLTILNRSKNCALLAVGFDLFYRRRCGGGIEKNVT